MRKLLRTLVVAALALLAGVLIAPTALANSAHFVEASGYIQNNAVHVSFQEAGLGNETLVHDQLTITATCENGGDNYASTQTVVVGGDFAVQDGEASGSLTATATCPPGQDVEIYDRYSVTDTTNGITVLLYGFVAR
jgi:hypothetical protein